MSEGIRYEGDINEEKTGTGKIIYPEDDSIERVSYEGGLLLGLPHGEGIMCWKDGGEYNGGWESGNRHGKGIHKYGNGSFYEGDWLDGFRHGKGTYKWPNGQSFEGEWQNDSIRGRGVMYAANHNRFEGYFIDVYPSGHTRITYANGDIYEGEYKNKGVNGRGKYTFAKGTIVYGDWKDGRKHGRALTYRPRGNINICDFSEDEMHGRSITVNGSLRISYDIYRYGFWKGSTTIAEPPNSDSVRWFPEENTYEYESGDARKYFFGMTKGGVVEGIGVLYMADGTTYAGVFENGLLHGNGVILYSHTDDLGRCVYKGKLEAGKPHGMGLMEWKNGASYSGEFSNGLREGNGQYKFANGDIYEGSYMADKRCGEGAYTFANGDSYVGTFEDNELNGGGIYTAANGEVYAGGFLGGKRHGAGKLTDTEGNVTKGNWENGVLIVPQVITEPNIILCRALEEPTQLICEKFDKDTLCSLLNCTDIDEIRTDSLSAIGNMFSVDVVCVYDSNAYANGGYENYYAEQLTENISVCGDCLICGKTHTGYAPLPKRAIEAILNY